MNKLLISSGFIGFLAVAFGAFGAHGLADSFTPKTLGLWETATLYALVHSVGALGIALSGKAGVIRLGGWLFIAGVIIFSGTLYAMALGAPTWLGAITPIGGLSFLAGWLLAITSGLKQKSV